MTPSLAILFWGTIGVFVALVVLTRIAASTSAGSSCLRVLFYVLAGALMLLSATLAVLAFTQPVKTGLRISLGAMGIAPVALLVSFLLHTMIDRRIMAHFAGRETGIFLLPAFFLLVVYCCALLFVVGTIGGIVWGIL